MTTAEFLPILVDMLPRTERIFLQLWANHGMSYEEIAELYECTENHVEIVVGRAIQRYEILERRPRHPFAEVL